MSGPVTGRRASWETDDRHCWRMAVALGGTELVTWGSLVYAFSVLLAPMQAEFGGSQVRITAAWSLSVLIRGLVSIPVGRLIDGRGVRWLMTGGCAAGVLVLLAWSRARTVPELYAVLILLGVVNSAVLYEPAFAAIRSWFVVRRADAMLLVTVLGGLASTAFLPFTGLLVDRLGWRGALAVLAGVLAATTVAPVALFVRDRPVPVPVPVPAPVPAPALVPAPAPAAATGPAPVSRAVRSRPFRWLTAAAFLSQAGLVTANVHLVTFIRERGFGLGLASLVAGLLGVLSVLGRVALTGAARRSRHGLARLTAGLIAVQSVAVVPLLVVPGLPGLIVFVLLLGSGYGVMTIARALLLADYVPADRYAGQGGLQAAVLTVGQVGAPVLGSVLRDAAGSYVPVFALVGVATAAAAACLVQADRAHQAVPAAATGPVAQ